MIDKPAIERKVRELHREMWLRRHQLWPMGHPPPIAMLDPAMAARVLGLEYERRDYIELDGSRGGLQSEGLGYLDQQRGLIVVSTHKGREVERFTGGHELGHAHMHPWVGERQPHRDLPFRSGVPRDRCEQEADYYSACFLMPRKLVEQEFAARFGTRRPLPRDETVAFHLRIRDPREFFSGSQSVFARQLAIAESFDRNRFISMAQRFVVSPGAMAIRLDEIGLVAV